MKLLIQHGSNKHEFDLPGDSKVEQLHEQIEVLGILKRRQKLIYKGKVLMPHHSLSQAKLSDGAKIMLIVSGGLTLGQAEAAAAEARQISAAESVKARNQERITKGQERQQQMERRRLADTMEVRSTSWAKTGIVALRDSNLADLPSEVWQKACEARTADLTNNRLTSLPDAFASMTRLEKLQLSRNLLTAMPDCLGPAFQRLQVLSLSHNRLTEVPEVCLQPAIKDLDLSNNQISKLSSSIGRMTGLCTLNLACNALDTLTAEIHKCTELVALNLSSNRLAALPQEISRLQLLRDLQLANNRIKDVPGELLRHCQSLQTINLHQNPLTIEQLRESQDFQSFDERRRAKYSKQMDMRLMSSTEGFDEGADHVEFNHFNARK